MKSIQIGESLTGDFEESTWTFEMQKDFKLSAGVFAIVDKEIYDSILSEGEKYKKQRNELLEALKESNKDLNVHHGNVYSELKRGNTRFEKVDEIIYNRIEANRKLIQSIEK